MDVPTGAVVVATAVDPAAPEAVGGLAAAPPLAAPDAAAKGMNWPVTAVGFAMSAN